MSTTMDAIMKDKRFAKIATNSKFLPVGKKKRKVAIDNRFKSMFQDERFVSKCTVDPRGRPKTLSSKENYKKFYELKGSDESDDSEDSNSEEDEKFGSDTGTDQSGDDGQIVSLDEDDSLTSQSEDEEQTKEKVNSEGGDDSSDKVEEEDLIHDASVLKKLHDDQVDYARGQANLYSDSSSDDPTTEEEDETEFDKWGEMDKDAERTEESTRRIAVCNMDWDRVGADDLFLAMSSFCPTGGFVKSVHIYVSEFGKERMEEEERHGPAELRRRYSNINGEKVELNDSESDEEIQKVKDIREIVREYQVNKMRYYYAIAEFDCSDTADRVYKECDGKEYESSSTRFDLRFVPDEMQFEQSPKSSCTTHPDPAQYKRKLFFNTALHQSKVKLTWDENDADKDELRKKAFEMLKEVNESGDFSFAKKLIGSASSDDQHEQTIKATKKKVLKKRKDKKNLEESEESDYEASDQEDEQTINKYRSLLFGIDKDQGEGGLEITWNENETSEEINNEPGGQKEDLTPWEKFLKKKKDKKENKKREKRKKEGLKSSDEEIENDIPEGIDISDPYFAEELATMKTKQSKGKVKKIRKDDEKKEEEEDKTDLNLLVMDSDDEKNHFNFKTIVDEHNNKSKKKKWKKKRRQEIEKAKAEKVVKDDFEVNVNDARFAAIYSRPEFNIDPSQQQFKLTRGMETLIGEKQKRLASGRIEQNYSHTLENHKAKMSKLDPEVTAALKSVKTKWEKNAKKKSKL